MNRRIHPSYRRDPCCGSGCDRIDKATPEKPCWGQVDMILPSRDHRCKGHRNNHYQSRANTNQTEDTNGHEE